MQLQLFVSSGTCIDGTCHSRTDGNRDIEKMSAATRHTRRDAGTINGSFKRPLTSFRI